MRKIRLVADSALHPAGSELHVVDSDAVASHAMDSVSVPHAEHLVASGLAEPVNEEARGHTDEASPPDAPDAPPASVEHIRMIGPDDLPLTPERLPA